MKVYRALFFTAVVFSIFACRAAVAEDAVVPPADPKAVVAAGKAAIEDQKQEVKANATDAKIKEQNLRVQMQQAAAAGDKEKAASLRAELKAAHIANMKERKADIKGLKDSRKKLHRDAKEAHKAQKAQKTAAPAAAPK
jgi:hypothetical protein